MRALLTEAARRAWRMLLAMDQALWVLLTLGYAWPDEAPSACAWRMERKGKVMGRVFRPLIDGVFARLPFGWAQQDHCRTAFKSELQRRHLPAEYQQHEAERNSTT